MKQLFNAVASIVLLAATPLAAEPGDSASSSPQAAQEQAVVEDPGHQPIPVLIWMPAKPADRLPLVVISHGTGAGPLSHVDTATALVKAGFVVVALMHPGDNFQDDGAVGKPAWFVDRSRHVGRVIDFMLTQWENHASIDPDRIGIFGFSAGATTALISAGGELDLALIGPHCAASPEFVCRIMVPVDHPQPAVWTHDPRIRAAIIAAPGVGFAFEPKSLAGVRIPIQLWAGSSDDTVPYKSNTAVVRDALRGSVDFHQVPDAVHLSFLSPCTTETPPFLCADKPGFDRAAFHASFNRAVVDFLRHYLATATRPPNDHQHSDN